MKPVMWQRRIKTEVDASCGCNGETKTIEKMHECMPEGQNKIGNAHIEVTARCRE
jgi:hypothetical protein